MEGVEDGVTEGEEEGVMERADEGVESIVEEESVVEPVCTQWKAMRIMTKVFFDCFFTCIVSLPQ